MIVKVESLVHKGPVSGRKSYSKMVRNGRKWYVHSIIRSYRSMFPIYSGYTTTGTPHKRSIGFLFCPHAHRAFIDWIPVRKYFWPGSKTEKTLRLA